MLDPDVPISSLLEDCSKLSVMLGIVKEACSTGHRCKKKNRSFKDRPRGIGALFTSLQLAEHHPFVLSLSLSLSRSLFSSVFPAEAE